VGPASQLSISELDFPRAFGAGARYETVKRILGRMLASLLILGAAALTTSNTVAADRFQKLTGSQIRAKFFGMEMTDNVHWADVFGPNGALRTISMSRKTDGKWWIDKNDLCVDRGADSGGCYQVWMSGQKVELRREGLDAPILEGVLQRQAKRQ
jgi:hypothetical protein